MSRAGQPISKVHLLDLRDHRHVMSKGKKELSPTADMAVLFLGAYRSIAIVPPFAHLVNPM